MDESVICPPLDYIQVFSSKLTSDSSILLKKKKAVKLCLVFARCQKGAEGFLRAATAGELAAY